MKQFNYPGIIFKIILISILYCGISFAIPHPDSSYIPFVDYRGFADEMQTPGGILHAKMVYVVNPNPRGVTFQFDTTLIIPYQTVDSISHHIVTGASSLLPFFPNQYFITITSDSAFIVKQLGNNHKGTTSNMGSGYSWTSPWYNTDCFIDWAIYKLNFNISGSISVGVKIAGY